MKRLGLSLALVALPSLCFADTAPLMPLAPYEEQGPFVVQPAKFVAAPVYGVGFMVGAFLCLPISLVQQGSSEEPVPHEKEASLICGKVTGTGLGWPIYAAVGLPLYILKKAFWDGPKALVHMMSHEPATPPPPGASPGPAPAPVPAQ